MEKISKIIKKGISLGDKIIPKSKISNAKAKLGLAPGSLIFTGERKMSKAEISIVQYDKDFYKEFTPKNIIEAIDVIKSFKGNSWVNIDGLHDEKIIEEICTYLGVHKLTMEDILSVGQRPKIEEYDDYLHFVLKMLMMESDEENVIYEQISFILKGNVLVTFQEKRGDVFDSVRKRIKEAKGTIRLRGADYILYALLDSVVDYYFFILEIFGEKLNDVETALLDNPDKSTLNNLHLLRREALNIRRSIYPLRDAVSQLERLEEPMISKSTKIFIRDLYDHTIKVVDTIEVLRETASGLLDLYMNSVSNKMNEVMKVLTIIATIFIPLTFIAGIYGMNFVYMPELGLKYGYFMVLGFMGIIFIAMLIYFKKKKWI